MATLEGILAKNIGEERLNAPEGQLDLIQQGNCILYEPPPDASQSAFSPLKIWPGGEGLKRRFSQHRQLIRATRAGILPA